MLVQIAMCTIEIYYIQSTHTTICKIIKRIVNLLYNQPGAYVMWSNLSFEQRVVWEVLLGWMWLDALVWAWPWSRKSEPAKANLRFSRAEQHEPVLCAAYNTFGFLQSSTGYACFPIVSMKLCTDPDFVHRHW